MILPIPISQTNKEDMLIWRGTARGIFSVKSAYHIQKEHESSCLAEGSLRKDHSKVWKEIWKLHIPNIEKMFFWRAC